MAARVCLCLLWLTLALAIRPGRAQQQRFEVQPEERYIVAAGADVRLRCLIRQRQGECFWMRNNKAVGQIRGKYAFSRAPDDGDCSLSIRNASVQMDDGQWQCQVTPAETDQETLQSREAGLVVLVAPERPQLKVSRISWLALLFWLWLGASLGHFVQHK